MKIAQLVGCFGLGGAERVGANLAAAMEAAGHQSVRIALRERGEYVDKGVLVHVLGARSGRLWSYFSAARRLMRLLRDERVQLIHVHGENALLLASMATRLMRRPPRLWFTWHVPEDVLECGLVRRVSLRWAMRQCERVFAASHDIAERLRRSARLRSGVAVFRNFVPEVPRSGGTESSEPLVLWYARLVPKKNPLVLVKAAAMLRDEGLRFRVVLAGGGNGYWDEYERQVHAAVDDMGLRELVAMPGWVSDMKPLLMQAAIGVQASETEGLSMSLLEQMMAGLAVVATDVGDTATAIRHEETGLLIRPNDEDGLAYALRRLIVDKSLRKQLGNAAREKAMRDFSVRMAASHVVGLL